MADEYAHYFVPIDCTPDAQRHAPTLARFVAAQPCKVTLAAVITPTPDAETRRKRKAHAQEALNRIATTLYNVYGIYTYDRIVEGTDHATAFAEESRSPNARYDRIILGAYQTRPEEREDLEAPCLGSLADRISQKSRLPVVILPFPTVTERPL